MDEVLGMIAIVWFVVASFGAFDNILYQTPDSRIISQCKDQGYINVRQTVVNCSIEKEVKKWFVLN